MRGLILALTGLSLFAAAPAFSQEADAVNKSLVRVIAFKDGKPVMVATGFAIGDKGFVATADHVVSAGEVRVLRDGEPSNLDRARPAKVVFTSKDLNFAIVEVPGLGAPGLAVAAEPAKQGATVYLFGYPGGTDRNSTLTSGIVERVAERPADGRNAQFLQHAAKGGPGTGGGPLVNACGAFVGSNGFLMQTGSGVGIVAAEIMAVAKSKNVAVAMAPPCAK